MEHLKFKCIEKPYGSEESEVFPARLSVKSNLDLSLKVGSE